MTVKIGVWGRWGEILTIFVLKRYQKKLQKLGFREFDMAPGTSAAHILGKCSTCRVWGLNLQIGVETSHPPQWFSLGLRYLNKAQSPK